VVNKVRLVSDGCGGQNKNNIVLGMAMSWLVAAPARINTVELMFPVRGHSFLPCDRLFGRIEKELKSKDSILCPKGYHDVFKNHCASMYDCGTDWHTADWKTAVSKIYKPLSNIQDAKRIIIDRSITSTGCAVISVKCEPNYNSNIAVKTNLLKRGQQHKNLNLLAAPTSRPVSATKLKDIHNLLKVSFSDKWKQLPGTEIYKQLKVGNVADDDAPDKDCMCADEEVAVRI